MPAVFLGAGGRRDSPGDPGVAAALFISPYVEYGGQPTGESPQGAACKPWTENISHFILAAPLARKGTVGDIVMPADRGPTDSEAINFIAPSHHASGPGGTCPAASVTVACAAYLYATMPERPRPGQVISLLRATSVIDQALLTSVPEFDPAAVERLQRNVESLLHPAEGKQRKLDAPGVLNLYRAVQAAGLLTGQGTQ